jgi:hypothetical protein
MATKTFKIGEYCQGGIITAVATEKKVTIIGKEWGTQEEFTRLEVDPNNEFAFRRLDEFLCDLTTNYYACKVIEWVESVVKLKNGLFC